MICNPSPSGGSKIAVGSLWSAGGRAGDGTLLLKGLNATGLERSRDHERHRGASISEMAGSADATAAVSAPTGEHQNVSLAPVPPEAFDRLQRQIPSGVLHHLEEVRAGLVNGDTVDLAHLRRSDRRHVQSAGGEKPDLPQRHSATPPSRPAVFSTTRA